MSSTVSVEQAPNSICLHNGQSVQFSSNKSETLDHIPIIDIAGIFSADLKDRARVAEEVRKAAHEIGFFYITNHGVDEHHATVAFDAAKNFFSLPTEDKMEVYTGKVPGEYVGYHPMEHYNRNEWKHRDLSEAFNFAYDASQDPEAIDPNEPTRSIWPEKVPEFRGALCAYHTQLLQLARRLARTFALALQLPEDYFDEYVKRPEAGMRVLHYPAQTRSRDEQQGIGAHTDVEHFTIVTQDTTSGLEVLSRSGKWIKAPPIPGSFVVNIADCFMRQTNDFFVSTVHRVINESGRERYSAPFFFGFDRKMRLEAVGEGERKYEVLTAGEYYAWRTRRQKNSGLKGVEVV